MIRSIIEDFTELMEEEMRTWDKFPKLSYDDELQYKGAKTCEICCVQFSKAKPKNKHHQWSSSKMKWSKQSGWEESNYVAALCSPCNLRITIKLN